MMRTLFSVAIQRSAAGFGLGMVATASLLAPLFLVQTSANQQKPTDARQSPFTFKVEVNYVEVDVTVTDSGGRFVRDLRRQDFEVREDGKLQEVSSFALVDLPYKVRMPVATLVPKAIELDVQSNAVVSKGRVFVLVLDDLHTHPLRSVQVKQVAREFIERYIGPDDLVSIIHTSGRSGVSQEFTSRSSLLLASVDRFMGRKVRSSTLERLEAYQAQPDRGTLGQESADRNTRADPRMQHVFDPRDAERGLQAESLLETLQRLGDLLANTRGRRKSVVLISEGIDYDIQNAVVQTTSGVSTFTSEYAQPIIRRLQQAIGTMTRANVAIYAIDPRGLATGGEDMIAVGSFPLNPLLGLGPGAFQDELRRAQDSLRVLSEQTGGVASVSSNNFSDAFERVMRDSSTYYLLGYRANNRRADGRFRKIEMLVKRPGLQVRARRGYLAPSSREAAGGTAVTAEAEPSAVLRQMLNNSLPVSGLDLQAFAAAFKGPDVNGSVLFGLEVDARNFRFAQEKGFYTDRLEAAVVALDDRGKFLEGDRHTVDLRLRPDTYELSRRNGLRLLFRLNLPAGRYQLRAAVHEAGAGAAGSVHYDIDVPNLQGELLSVSGLVLTSTSAVATPTPRSDPDLQPLLKYPPTGSRLFTPADTLGVAFALYHDAGKPVGMVDVITRVAAEDGSVRFNREMEVPDDELRDAPDGYGLLVEIPLADMAPGAYVLRVEARSRLGEVVRAVRELPFRIRTAESAGMTGR